MKTFRQFSWWQQTLFVSWERHHAAILVVVATLAVAGCDKPESKQADVLLELGMVYVPPGEFVMGSNKTDDKGIQQRYGFVNPLFVDEHPQQKVFLPGYHIDRFEVSNIDYKRYLIDTGAADPPHWIQNGYNARPDVLRNAGIERLRFIAENYFQLEQDVSTMDREEILKRLVEIQASRDTLPVSGVSWFDAASYCRWAAKRLPSEQEWEKAARGQNGWEYPWGNEWDDKKANTGESPDQPAPLVAVGSSPADVSPFGVHDMAGNVSEWVEDWYKPYPGATYQSEAYGDVHKVIRGGGAGSGHYALSTFFRSARRAHAEPGAVSVDVGFRCAKDVQASD